MINLSNIQEKTILSIKSNLIICLKLLNDKRLAISTLEYSIFIFNKITYEIDINIKNYQNKPFFYFNQLSNNNLITCSSDEKIIIYKIYNKTFEITDILIEHILKVNKVIEIKNEIIISCSNDATIKFWKKNNNEIYNNFKSLEGTCDIKDIFNVNENILVSASPFDESITFWDLEKMKVKRKIFFIKSLNSNIFCKINKQFLLVIGNNYLYIIDIWFYKIFKKIYILNNVIECISITENNLIAGDINGNLVNYIFENEEMKIKFEKNNIHQKAITYIIKSKNNQIITCSFDKLIKIWQY